MKPSQKDISRNISKSSILKIWWYYKFVRFQDCWTVSMLSQNRGCWYEQ